MPATGAQTSLVRVVGASSLTKFSVAVDASSVYVTWPGCAQKPRFLAPALAQPGLHHAAVSFSAALGVTAFVDGASAPLASAAGCAMEASRWPATLNASSLLLGSAGSGDGTFAMADAQLLSGALSAADARAAYASFGPVGNAMPAQAPPAAPRGSADGSSRHASEPG